MMNHMAQPSTFETWDAKALDTRAGASDAATSQAPEADAVEYGSGWYHEEAIAASARATAQKH